MNLRIYERAAEPYREPQTLRDLAERNPSFGLFVARLVALQARPADGAL